MDEWNNLPEAVLKFSTEDQLRDRESCNAITLRRLGSNPDAFAVLEGDWRTADLIKGKKISLEIDGERKGWVVPVVDEAKTSAKKGLLYRRLYFIATPEN